MEYNIYMYGKILKDLRLEKNLTQKQLADILGIRQENVSKYENELLDLNTDMIAKICKYFDITADYLLGIDK